MACAEIKISYPITGLKITPVTSISICPSAKITNSSVECEKSGQILPDGSRKIPKLKPKDLRC